MWIELSRDELDAAKAWNAAHIEPVPAGLRAIITAAGALDMRFGFDDAVGSAFAIQTLAEQQRALGVAGDGKWGKASSAAYAKRSRRRFKVKGTYPAHVRPGSAELRAACVEACQWLKRPELTPAEFLALSNIVRRESDGHTMRPNYTADRHDYYRSRRVDMSARYSKPENISAWEHFAADIRRDRIRTKSSAVGQGQLLGSNYAVHCPIGRLGIGSTVAELAAMITYCDSRYNGPIPAWEFYGLDHCPPDRRSYYSARALVIGCKPGEGY